MDSLTQRIFFAGKSGTRAKRGLRDGDDVREPVRRGNQGSVGGRRYTGVLRSQTGIPAHGLSQVVSISAALRSPFRGGGAHSLVYYVSYRQSRSVIISRFIPRL